MDPQHHPILSMVRAEAARIMGEEDAAATTMEVAVTITDHPKATMSTVVNPILPITMLLHMEAPTHRLEAIRRRSPNGDLNMAILHLTGIRPLPCPPTTTTLTTLPSPTLLLSTRNSLRMAVPSHTLIKALLPLLTNPSGVVKDNRLRTTTAMAGHEVAIVTAADRSLQ